MSEIETASFAFRETGVLGLWIVTPKRFSDHRGYLFEAYNRAEFAEAGLVTDFTQENQSFSPVAGAVRGLHFMDPPAAKHIRVAAGRVFNVCVDIRAASPSFGQAHCMELSAERGEQIYMEAGFAHGVLTLADQTVIAYQVGGAFAVERQRGIRWDDPDLAIPWPLDRSQLQLSAKDEGLPLWAEVRRGRLQSAG